MVFQFSSKPRRGLLSCPWVLALSEVQRKENKAFGWKQKNVKRQKLSRETWTATEREARKQRQDATQETGRTTRRQQRGQQACSARRNTHAAAKR